MTAPAHQIQAGIAFGPRERAAPYYRLVLLDAARGSAPAAVAAGAGAVHELLGRLARGHVPELEGQPAETEAESRGQFETLEHLIAFGRRLFDSEAHAPAITAAPRPDYLAYLPADGPFPALRWLGGTPRERGEADIAVQLTAVSQAAVDCAAVEIWKLLDESDTPLRVVASFAGFGRHDGRGWLGFHDGVSNLESTQRLRALEAPPHPEWMGGGTYMAFLRLAIDLAAWHRLPRPAQELLVGRDKLTGGALVGAERDAHGDVIPVAAPRPGPEADDRARGDFIDPPQSTHPAVEASHVHRANQNRGSAAAPSALRMFRQGYDFLDGFVAGEARVGLNFVSFQRDLAILQHVLHLPGWLGDVDFGGPVGDPHRPPLVGVLAGGLYAVPPRGPPFPGAEVFASEP